MQTFLNFYLELKKELVMKRLYFNFFILFSAAIVFGFRGCHLGEETFLSLLTAAAFGTDPGFGLSPDAETSFGIAVGNDGDVYTKDSPASSWVQQSSPVTENLNSTNIFAIYDPITFFGCAVGNNGTVIWSTDKGHTWEDLSFATASSSDINGSINFFGVDFISYSYLEIFPIACGDDGKIYKSTDGGGGNWTWQEVNTITTNRLNSIAAITSDLIIAVGEKGTIIRTSDGGQTWENKSIGDTSIYLNKILIGKFYPNFDRGWIVGTKGKIYRTTDYGNSWLSTDSGTDKDLNCISFRNSEDGIVAGDDGTVRYTTDGGLEWLGDPYFNGITPNDIVSIARVDSNTANALVRGGSAGDSPGADTTYSYVVSSEPLSAVEGETTSTPLEFSLEQNYPNPFNPGTIIRFTLYRNAFVSLKVYDTTGKEISTLINDDKSSGEYEVHFFDQDLASGIYFAVLEAGSHIETIKMILLK